MKDRDFFDYVLSVEHIVEIGEEISQELQVVSSVMRDSVDTIDLFLEDNKYTCKSLESSILDFVTDIVKKSETKISRFEEELETVSNYSSEDELLTVDTEFLDKLTLTSEMNLFMRIQLEEYLSNLEVISNIVEEITANLNKQRTEAFLGSRLLM